MAKGNLDTRDNESLNIQRPDERISPEFLLLRREDNRSFSDLRENTTVFMIFIISYSSFYLLVNYEYLFILFQFPFV